MESPKSTNSFFGVDCFGMPSLIWDFKLPQKPFDFVVSNNTCSRGNGTDMRPFGRSAVLQMGLVLAVRLTLTLVAGTAT